MGYQAGRQASTKPRYRHQVSRARKESDQRRMSENFSPISKQPARSPALALLPSQTEKPLFSALLACHAPCTLPWLEPTTAH